MSETRTLDLPRVSNHCVAGQNYNTRRRGSAHSDLVEDIIDKGQDDSDTEREDPDADDGDDAGVSSAAVDPAEDAEERGEDVDGQNSSDLETTSEQQRRVKRIDVLVGTTGKSLHRE